MKSNYITKGEKNIKYLLSKSKFLILFFSSVSVLISLCVTTIVDGYNQTINLSDFLSNKHIILNLSSDKDLKVSALTEKFNHEENILIYRTFPFARGKEVFFKGKTNFAPQIVSGTNFSNDDFDDGTNAAIVAETYVDKCVDRNGQKYLFHNNIEYEVVGIYRNPKRTINPYAEYYVNLNSKDSNQSLNGTYFIDGATKSKDDIILAVKGLDQDINVSLEYYEPSFSASVKALFNNLGIVVTILVLCVVLVLLNIFSCTANWIEGRNNEVAIRKLVGAKDWKVFFMVVKDFILLLTGGFIIGVLISVILLKLQIFVFIPDRINFNAVILSYLICLIISLITITVSLIRRFNRPISKELMGR